MIEFPWAYNKIDPTTWAYMSSLLMLAVFFKFSRFWSIRNVDLFLIILLAPGLLLYQQGKNIEKMACNSLATENVYEPLSLTSGGNLVRPTRRSPSPTENRTPSKELNQAPNLDQNSPISSENFPMSLGSEGTNPDQTEQQSEPASKTDSKFGERPGSAGSPSQIDKEPPKASGQTQSKEFKDEQKAREKRIDYLQKRRVLGLTLLRSAFYFLLIVSAILLIRLLLDQILVRKPLLGNNLSPGGMTFVLCGLLTFLIANIVVSQPEEKDLLGAKSAAKILGDKKGEQNGSSDELPEAEMGPAYPLIHLLPVLSTVIHDQAVGESSGDPKKASSDETFSETAFLWVAKMMAIFSQFAIVAGLIALGRYHFGSLETGIGMATIYLMLPYTAQMTGRIDHVLPSALLLWAVVLYRFPFWAGILFGLVFGLVYYPVFLLALWLSFYWEKGALRFTYGVLVMFGLLVLSLLLISTDQQPFLYNLQTTFGIRLPRISGLKGIWELAWDPWFRLPFLVAFVSLCFSFVAWPPRKTLGTLMAYSAAAMVAAQFWHGDGGGLYMAWFLPLTLATFFRPNLHQKIATSEVK